ncbi:MAG: P1 family peptidase [Bryobacterales bacterium]|nr:P1 family peptidase [Bryobacterales bacterium]
MKGLTDIPGVRVGHATNLDALTGCTVVLFDRAVAAGYDVRGSASGTAEFFVMDPDHIAGGIHAVCLAGGSAFGLAAGDGVRAFLEHKGVGFKTAHSLVPIVPTAILYDLGIGKSTIRPNAEMGALACEAATDYAVLEGAVGAGTGATVGKARGAEFAMKSGVGSATVRLGGEYEGVMVSALAAVNAYGDVLDPATGEIIAGARTAADGMSFANTSRLLIEGRMPDSTAPIRVSPGKGENTTLVVVATNAQLDRVEARKLAQLAQLGLTRAISPAHTMVDGDLVIAASVGERKASMMALGAAAAEAVGQAIVRAVRTASSLGGYPGLAELPARTP